MRKYIAVLALLFAMPMAGHSQAVDPGPRGGTVNAGTPIAGLSADQLRFFQDGLARFTTEDTVSTGLGPRFNAMDCALCHSQPAIGGSSPSTSAFPFVGQNPEIAAASEAGAANVVPAFVTPDGPAREARFKYVLPSAGSGGGPRLGFAGDRAVFNPEEQPTPDGTVHDLFTITGRSDASGCSISQPDFNRAIKENNIIFRIPTPVFGVGLVEAISEATILNNSAATARQRAILGIGGIPNRSGNDSTITRFGWKAQNKSMAIFAGEAYNVEVGVTNEVFPNSRGDSGTPDPANCTPLPQPEDSTTFLSSGDPIQVLSDIQQFGNFMVFLDQPTPGPSSASTKNGLAKFTAIGCALCHTPSMVTGTAAIGALSNVQVNLFSDLLLHHMGEGLADGISQGNAGPDQFRTSPLWGVGQRAFFLHDGRTSDLGVVIEQHKSQGSEANHVIDKFNSLSQSDRQDILNFLRSL